MEWWGYLIIAVVGGTFLGIAVLWVARRFKGNIKINMNRNSMIPGDKMGGDLELTIRKPIESNHLEALLIIQEKVQERRDGQNHTRTQEIYRDKVRIADGQVYKAGDHVTYPFELTVPDIGSDTQNRSSQGGIMGTVLHAIASNIGDRREYIWELEARLDAPGLDLVTTKKLNSSGSGFMSSRTSNSFSINAS